MPYGRVENRHALIEVTFDLPDGNLSVEFVIDTGFTDSLCLPQTAVEAMNLPFQFDFPATLADGSVVMLPVHEAHILWDNSTQRVHVLATGNRPLIGTALLDGFELTIPFRENARVSLKKL